MKKVFDMSTLYPKIDTTSIYVDAMQNMVARHTGGAPSKTTSWIWTCGVLIPSEAAARAKTADLTASSAWSLALHGSRKRLKSIAGTVTACGGRKDRDHHRAALCALG